MLDRWGTQPDGQPGGWAGQGGSGGACNAPEQCPGDDTTCRYRTCVAHTCGFENAAVATPCHEDGGSVCDGNGHCVKDLGEPCSEPNECLSGFCVDGYCCESQCDGPCEACDPGGSQGECVPHAAGTDPESDCTDGVCDGTGACASGAYLWSQRFGDSALQEALGLAVDNSDSIIITGRYAGQVDFGAEALPPASGYDVFLAKFQSDGIPVWSGGYGGSDDQTGRSVTTDSAGRIATTGYFRSEIFFDVTPLTTTAIDQVEAYVASLQPNGTHIWSIDCGGTNADNQNGRSVATDSSDNVVATGQFQGTANFGGSDLTSAGSWDIYLVKFDSGGNHQWSYQYGDASSQYSWHVAVDPTDNILLTGYFLGSVDFGGATLASTGAADVYLAKLDASGGHVWSQRFGDASDQYGLSAVADATGNVVLVGGFQGTIDFGTGPLTSAGFEDIFVAKFDSSGNPLWARRYGGPDGTAEQRAIDVAFDSSGNVIVFGRFQGSLDFGSGTINAAGLEDIFVLKLSTDGTVLWSRVFGGPGASTTERGFGVAVNSANEIIITGYFEGTIDFGGGALTSAGGTDVYLAKLAP